MRHSLKSVIPRSPSVCQIDIQDGLLEDRSALRECFGKLGERIAIVTHRGLDPLYGEPLRRLLAASGFEVHVLSFAEGEQYKSRQTKEHLEDQLLERGLGRDTCLVALGGGIVSDMAGYIAATYCRGVPLVIIPTSLLAMVDACMGGKSGVNVPQGKNLVGCIYQPKAILIDPFVLHSLPPCDLRNGAVEMIKHGLVADAAYFNWLERHAAELLSLKASVVHKAIVDSCHIKTSIVARDEREGGIRSYLNYGHTIGHALERLTDYALSHGEAVAIGLVVESRISVDLGLLPQSDYQRILAILRRCGLPLKIPLEISLKACLGAMAMDKKSLKGKPRFTLLSTIGHPHGNSCSPIDDGVLARNLKWMIDDLCRC